MISSAILQAVPVVVALGGTWFLAMRFDSAMGVDQRGLIGVMLF